MSARPSRRTATNTGDRRSHACGLCSSALADLTSAGCAQHGWARILPTSAPVAAPSHCRPWTSVAQFANMSSLESAADRSIGQRLTLPVLMGSGSPACPSEPPSVGMAGRIWPASYRGSQLALAAHIGPHASELLCVPCPRSSGKRRPEFTQWRVASCPSGRSLWWCARSREPARSLIHPWRSSRLKSATTLGVHLR